MSLLLSCFRIVLIGALIVGAGACASRPKGPSAGASGQAQAIDLQRFMGNWHVIAHIPYFAERGHVTGRYEYTLRSDKHIGVRYLYREGFAEPVQIREARATVKPDSADRDWTLWFVGVVPAKFHILEVAPDYSWALISYPERDLGWIFARSAEMDDTLYQQLVRKMRDHGVNARQLVREPQIPAQVGQPGFAAPKNP